MEGREGVMSEADKIMKGLLKNKLPPIHNSPANRINWYADYCWICADYYYKNGMKIRVSKKRRS